MEKSILKQALPTEKNTVKQDSFDKSAFSQMRDAAEPLKTAEKTGQELLKTFNPLMEDVFAGLYKYSPEVREPKELKPSHRVNHSLINKAMETEQWGQLRNYTRLDPVNTAMATVTIANKLAEIIKTDLKDEAEQANQCAEAEDASAAAQATYESLCDIASRTAGTPQGAKYKKQATAAQKAAAKARKLADDTAAQLDQTLPGAQQKIRQAMRSAEQAAINEVQETSSLLEAWGTEPGQITLLPAETRIALAQKMSASQKMKKLAKMIGRFRRLAVHAQKTKVNRSQDEIYSMEQGNDLNRIIPSELALLRNPLTKREFGRKYTEGKLMQYKLRGNERAGKGPIVVCGDGSGSMSGDKELWCKAVTLGLLEIAQLQHRAFASIQFGSKNELDTVIIQKNEKNIIEKVIRIAEVFLNGGTCFETPLDKAVEIINQQEFRKADIVFITDGESEVGDEWLAKFLQIKKEKEVRISAILCDFGSTSTSTVSKFADQLTATSDLTDLQAVDIFGSV